MDASIDYYAYLGVPETATDAEIRAKYKKLAFIYHPDKNLYENKESTTRRFQKLLDAYEVLSNGTLRICYDSERIMRYYDPPIFEYNVQDPLAAYEAEAEAGARRPSHGTWQRTVVRVNKDLGARAHEFTEEEEEWIQRSAWEEEEYILSKASKNFFRHWNSGSGLDGRSFRRRPRRGKGMKKGSQTETEKAETKKAETKKAETKKAKKKKAKADKPEVEKWKPRSLRRRN